jgi:hypothetical protein
MRRQIFIEHCEVQGYLMGLSLTNTLIKHISGTHTELNIIYSQNKKGTLHAKKGGKSEVDKK